MAKATAEKKISPESNAMLLDAKKKKPRKFVLIVKGSSDIKTLIVFKKGPYKSHIQSAKSSGDRGNAYCGIVVGDGPELAFKLAGSKAAAEQLKVEGIVKGDPTKTEKLKTFLKDHSDLPSPKVRYEIITDAAQLSVGEESQDSDDAAAAGENAAAGGEKPAQGGGSAEKQVNPATKEKIAASKTKWQAAKKDFRTDVDKVMQAIQKAVPEEGQKIVDRVEELLDIDGFFDRLSDAMDTASEKGDIQPVIRSIKEYAAKTTDPLIMHMDKNPFVKVSLSKTLATGLKELAQDAKSLKV